MENLEEYITLVVDNSVKAGIARQMRAFWEGFQHVGKPVLFYFFSLPVSNILKQMFWLSMLQVFQMSSLQIFNEEQLSYMLCGCREMWQVSSLLTIVFLFIGV